MGLYFQFFLVVYLEFVCGGKIVLYVNVFLEVVGFEDGGLVYCEVEIVGEIVGVEL